MADRLTKNFNHWLRKKARESLDTTSSIATTPSRSQGTMQSPASPLKREGSRSLPPPKRADSRPPQYNDANLLRSLVTAHLTSNVARGARPLDPPTSSPRRGPPLPAPDIAGSASVHLPPEDHAIGVAVQEPGTGEMKIVYRPSQWFLRKEDETEDEWLERIISETRKEDAGREKTQWELIPKDYIRLSTDDEKIDRGIDEEEVDEGMDRLVDEVGEQDSGHKSRRAGFRAVFRILRCLNDPDQMRMLEDYILRISSPCFSPADNSTSGSNFSAGRKQYFVEGFVELKPIEAFPDSGADCCLISPGMAASLGLEVVPGTARTIHLANKKPVRSPGMVPVAWKFSGESRVHVLECWVLPGCLHPLVLGSKFLRATHTLTKFASRIKSRLVSLPKRLRLRLLGEEKQRLWGYLDGRLTAALPDTGSDVMLVSGDYAQKIGLSIDRDSYNWLEVEFADGSTAWTSGVARNVPWAVGGKTVRCDFHVLDHLCVDVVLSNDYLFETRVFSEHSDCFFDTDSEEDLFQLCNIRLIGRFSDGLGGLEDEYLEDVNVREPFSPDMVSREVARRDQIRDKIDALPPSQQDAARRAEAERQRRWHALREEYRTGASGGDSSSESQEPAHRTATNPGRSGTRLSHSHSAPTWDAARRNAQEQPARRGAWWKKRVNVSIPLRYLRKSEST